jgi:hypothetical protein
MINQMNKIFVRIFGGLGNQLFAYAAARRLAIFNNSELIIDHISGFQYDKQYQRHYQLNNFNISCRKASPAERLEPFARIRRRVLRERNLRRPFEQRNYLVQEGNDFEPRLLSLRPNKWLHIEGYWQSEGYFKDVESQIRQDLRIIPPTDTNNLQCADFINQRIAVAVHVRFFDDPASAGGNNATRGYYQRSVQTMEASLSGAHYFVFSDRPDAARSLIPLPDERITLVLQNKGDELAYADLWLMAQCKHFIIANSTFSWWGAWLAESNEKIVISPVFEKRNGVGAWGFDGLLPEKWIRLSNY